MVPPWLASGRAASPKLSATLAFLFIAGTCAGILAETAVSLHRRAAPSTRFAAASLVLFLVTTGMFCSLTTLLAVREHFGESHPLHIYLLIFLYAGAASLYDFLAIGGRLLLPLGLPVLIGYAALISRAKH